MCYINWRPEELDWDDENTQTPGPRPRPVPQLKWVIPVDIVELGATLEAYYKQIPQITTLRLCHRFGNGGLSKVPQEIVDYIISDIQRMDKQKIHEKWDSSFRCFQGRCSRSEHLHPEVLQCCTTEYLFQAMFVDQNFRYKDRNSALPGGPKWLRDEPLDPKNYTPKERAEIVDDHLYDDTGYESYDEGVLESHIQDQDEWLSLVCRCKKPLPRYDDSVSFNKLTKILRSHSGMDAIILHEALSDSLRAFLPDISGAGWVSYSTTCFLALAPKTVPATIAEGRLAKGNNGGFLHKNNHLAFHEFIEPAQLSITSEQRQRFAHAMRFLDLKPHFHLSNLESLLTPYNQDKDFWAICDTQVYRCPKTSSEKRRTKRKKLRLYLQVKDKDVAKQPWPQLINLASSDAVVPSRG